jgi:hypothetical protein
MEFLGVNPKDVLKCKPEKWVSWGDSEEVRSPMDLELNLESVFHAT